MEPEEAEVQAPSTEDTPVDAPEAGGTEPVETPSVDDWEKRYKDVQSTYTRTSQELAQLKQQAARYEQALQSDDPDALRALLAEHGWQLPGTDTEEPPDPTQQMMQEWQEFKATQQQAAQDAQLDALEKQIVSGIEAEAKTQGFSLSDRARDLIFSNVIANPPGEDGQPNIKKAFADYAAERDEIIKGYRETKKDAPQPVSPGQPGTPSVPLGDARARRELAIEVANRSYGST